MQLGSENQDLMEKTMILTDRIRDLEQQHNAEADKLQRRLIQDMSVCFQELESLVEVCIQGSQGQEPNVSLLLGVRGRRTTILENVVLSMRQFE